MPRTLKPIRWTLEQAASEFGIDRKTLSGRVKNGGLLPGDDGKFSTSAICRAVFTDGEAARAALAISQKENVDVRTLRLAEKLADCAVFQSASDAVIIALRQRITDAPIPPELKSEILKDIQNINVDELVKENPKADDSNLEDEP